MAIILNQATAEGDAKLRSLSHRHQEGTNGTVELVREWIEIDATVADTLHAALSATTKTTPMADGQTYAGTWTVSENRIEGDDSRAVKIVQVLSLLDATGVVSTWLPDCDTSVTRTVKFNQTKAQYDTIVALYEGSNDGVHVEISPYNTNALGLVDVTTTVITKQARNVPTTATGAFSTGTFKGKTSFAETREWVQIGVTSDNNLRSVADADGVIKSRNTVIEDDCSKRVTTVEQTATAVSPVEKVKQITAFATDVQTTIKNATSREAEESVQTQNQIVTTTSELTETPGRFDNKLRTLSGTVDADVGNERVVSAFEDRTVATAKNEVNREKPVTSLTPGTISETSSVENDFKSFDNRRVDRVATAVPNTVVTNSLNTVETRTVTESEHQAAGLSAPSVATGYARTNTSTMDEFGRYRTRSEEALQNDIGVSAYTAIKTLQMEATREVFKNRPFASQPTLSESYGELNIHRNDVGLWDGTKTVVTYKQDGAVQDGGYGNKNGVVQWRIEKQAWPTYPANQGYRWRWIEVTYDHGFRGSSNGAHTEIHNGLPGSWVRQKKTNLFEWHKVVSIVASTTWTTDGTLSATAPSL